MNKDNLVLNRQYQPDQDAMVNALSLILRYKGPSVKPDEENMTRSKNVKETVGNSLQAQPTVPSLTVQPDAGGSCV